MRRESTFKKDKLAKVLAQIDADPVLLELFNTLDEDFELRERGFEFEISTKFAIPNTNYFALPCNNEKVDIEGTENLNRVHTVTESRSGLDIFEKIDATKPALVLYNLEIVGYKLYQI